MVFVFEAQAPHLDQPHGYIHTARLCGQVDPSNANAPVFEKELYCRRQSEIHKPLVYLYSWLEPHIESRLFYIQQALPICADDLFRDCIHRTYLSGQRFRKRRLADGVGSSDRNYLWPDP
jgi:hypothetical protein